MITQLLFLALLFIVAMLYSSVGHGGASGYLAVMALFAIDTFYMKASALTLNLFVSGIAFYQFKKAGYFSLKTILPFVITSIPLAFLGAKIPVNPKLYNIMLGVFLILAILRILFIKADNVQIRSIPTLAALCVGAILGFLSGMIGIGGGIILSPLLILFRWANIKQAAAASSLFILLNSVSGLTGIYSSETKLPSQIFIWTIIAFIGGLAGSYIGSKKLTFSVLSFILSGILLLASIKLLFYLK